jgi:hypothetical protein
VFQAAHNDAVQRLLGQLKALDVLEVLDVDEGAHKLCVQGTLVIEPLGEGHDAAGNAEDLARSDGGRLLVVLPLLGVLNDNDLIAALEDLQKLAELLVGAVTC